MHVSTTGTYKGAKFAKGAKKFVNTPNEMLVGTAMNKGGIHQYILLLPPLHDFRLLRQKRNCRERRETPVE